jgi:murein DD-endopeptidase MepM/ murein hydrolase activator NlpD
MALGLALILQATPGQWTTPAAWAHPGQPDKSASGMGHSGPDDEGSIPISPIKLSTFRPKQGEVVEVVVAAKDLEMTDGVVPPLVFLKNSYKLFPFEGIDGPSYRALLTVPVVQKIGSLPLQIGNLSTRLIVMDAHYPVQRLTLPKSKNNFIMAKGEEEAVDKAKATVSAERHWTSNFTPPSKARLSSGFGMRRIVNGKLLDDYFHSGLDYAGNLGSPIAACAPGTVILASTGVFKLHGNTVAIDHGQGVVSFYIHMQKVNVKLGQKVAGGQVIGAIGQTGRANGPHLHFSIYCNNAASNPRQWYLKAFK